MAQYAVRILTPVGWQDIAVQGPKGDTGDAGANGVMEVYEQPGTPEDANDGAVWIDTDDTPVVSDRIIEQFTLATRPSADLYSPGEMIFVTDEDFAKQLQISDGTYWHYISVGLASGQTLPTIPFSWVSDGDTNGVIYWMGTRSGAFQSPVPDTAQASTAIGTDLRIDVSSTYPDGTFKIKHAVDRNPATVWESQEATGNYFHLDFLSRKFKPNRYSWQARNDLAVFWPRSWVLEGSDDASTWTALDTRTNNTTISSIGAWGTFTCTSANYYRYIRVRLTAPTHDGYNLMAINSFELYGVLLN